jgi:hypothetical protein
MYESPRPESPASEPRPARFPLKFSVIIPVNGETEPLQACLAFGGYQRYPNFEFIVSAYGDDDHSIPMVQLNFPYVRCYRSPAATAHEAVNHAATIARGDVLALTRPWAIPDGNWLWELADLYLDDQETAGTWGPTTPHESDLADHLLAATEAALDWTRLVPTFENATMHAAAFDSAGGFDPSIPDPNCALIELQARVEAAGYPIPHTTTSMPLRVDRSESALLARIEERGQAEGWLDALRQRDRRRDLKPAGGRLFQRGPTLTALERSIARVRYDGYLRGQERALAARR